MTSSRLRPLQAAKHRARVYPNNAHPLSRSDVPTVPELRIQNCNSAQVRADGQYVLYWMIATRRLSHNFSLDRALELGRDLGKPIVIFEALRCGYRWASDRIHQFVIDGMADNAAVCEQAGVLYYPYVEPKPGAGQGLLEALAADACVVITDDFPCFFLPRMVAAAAKKLPVRLEEVDSNGLLPVRGASQVFSTAYSFRRFLQKTLPGHLAEGPIAAPFAKRSLGPAATLSKKITTRWPSAAPLLKRNKNISSGLPIDHDVMPSALRGGAHHAREQMNRFLDHKFPRYAEDRNKPEIDVTSGFSPYLHFGYLSVHQIFAEVALREKWGPEKLALRANGSRDGWWNMSANAEGFLDELITWREIGYNFSSHRSDYSDYESLPDWAKGTLQKHIRDRREHVYSLDEFASGRTHDPLWNAAQGQLVQEGRIHNYLRMLWGKKILEWSPSPKEALATLIELNNKYGLDGRNPNSYSGIFWCLGRYDRPWGPERPIYGQIRYMTSENTARKVSVKNYIRKYASNGRTDQASLAF
jgi:deoxyribodipyrimidine photo-lyase